MWSLGRSCSEYRVPTVNQNLRFIDGQRTGASPGNQSLWKFNVYWYREYSISLIVRIIGLNDNHLYQPLPLPSRNSKHVQLSCDGGAPGTLTLSVPRAPPPPRVPHPHAGQTGSLQ